MKTTLLTNLWIAQKYVTDVANFIELKDKDTDPSLDKFFEEVLYQLDCAWLNIEDAGKMLQPFTEFVGEEESPDQRESSKQSVFYTPAVVIDGDLAHLQYDVADLYAKHHKTIVRNDKGYILADYRVK